MGLIKQADLEARIGRELTVNESAAFPTLNAAVQTYVERMIGSAVEEAGSTTRYFDGGWQHLAIDPCTDVTAVTQVDDDDVLVYTYDPTDYSLDPKNYTLKTMIRHRSGPFMRGINNIAVTAKFSVHGDADILAAVKSAMLDALAGEVDNSGEILKESIEGYAVEFARPQTRDALNKIRYLFPEV